MSTIVRRTTLTLPAAPLGPANPLPALRPLDELHDLDETAKRGLPPDMARQIGYEPLRDTLPVQRLDGYTRERRDTELEALVLENDRLRATVLPGLGGRLHSLFHKGLDRELLYVNPVLQPADFALAGAWFSGGVEWNLGATGHTTLTCAPMHAARVPAPDGGEMLRLWEWERLRDLPYQVDMWLPEDSDFLYVGVRVRNPHHEVKPVYWWSNIAVPETADTRVLTPADEAWHFGYARTLDLVTVPAYDGIDRTYPLRSDYPADYFYEIPDGARRWITALDDSGQGLVQTSTDVLRGRKLFLWGHGRGGQQWQRWLNGGSGGGYLEIQAGLARTQLEHIPLDPGDSFAWLEAYGPLAADAASVHGDDWAAARAEAGARLEEALPRAAVDGAFAAWLPYADAEPKESLAAGSGWGALEVERAGFDLPGTPFDAATLGADQAPWAELLRTGRLPEGDVSQPPGAGPVAAPWRDLLEGAPSGPLTDFHLGVAQWHAGDRAQAVRSWERSTAAGRSAWAVRCLAVAALEAGDREAGVGHYLAAAEQLLSDGPPTARSALVAEAVPVWLAADRPDLAASVLARLPDDVRASGRFRLLHARVLLAQGDVPAARAVFDSGFEVADLREGTELLGEVWYAIAERLEAGDDPVTEEVRTRARERHPLPERYDFRMRPQPSS